MCYAYSLKKRVLKEASDIRKETVSIREQVKAWINEAKKPLIVNKPKQADVSHAASSRARERVAS